MARVDITLEVGGTGNLEMKQEVHLREGDLLVFNNIPPGAAGVHADMLSDLVALYVRGRAVIGPLLKDASNNVVIKLDAESGGGGPDETP